MALGSWSKAGGFWCPRQQVCSAVPSDLLTSRILKPRALNSPWEHKGKELLGCPGHSPGTGVVLRGRGPLLQTPPDINLARRGAALGFEEKYI